VRGAVAGPGSRGRFRARGSVFDHGLWTQDPGVEGGRAAPAAHREPPRGDSRGPVGCADPRAGRGPCASRPGWADGPAASPARRGAPPDRGSGRRWIGLWPRLRNSCSSGCPQARAAGKKGSRLPPRRTAAARRRSGGSAGRARPAPCGRGPRATMLPYRRSGVEGEGGKFGRLAARRVWRRPSVQRLGQRLGQRPGSKDDSPAACDRGPRGSRRGGPAGRGRESTGRPPRSGRARGGSSGRPWPRPRP